MLGLISAAGAVVVVFAAFAGFTLFAPSPGSGTQTKTQLEINHIPQDPAEKMAFDFAKAENTMSAYNRFIEQYPHSKYRKEASALFDAMWDEQMYASAQNTGSIEAYESFIRRSFGDRYIEEARTKLEELYRDRAVHQRKPELYLRKYPDGRFVGDVQAIKDAQQTAEEIQNQYNELESFVEAGNTGTIDAWQNYLDQFPEGAHAQEAVEEIEKLVYEQALGAMIPSSYINRYPQGAYADQMHRLADSLIFAKYDSLGTIDAYQDYMDENPDGVFYAYADTKIEQIKLVELEEFPKPDEFIPVEKLPEPIHQEKPVYPPNASKAGFEGTVWIKALVDVDGKIKEAFVQKKSGTPALDNAALEAAFKCTYAPGEQNGQPVAVWISYKVEFNK